MSHEDAPSDESTDQPTQNEDALTSVDSEHRLPLPRLSRLSVPSALTEAGSEPMPRYELREFLGAGGNGQVYAAFDRDLQREVAIKVIPAWDTFQHGPFTQEARVTASLGHPNVPPLYDAGVTRSTRYLTMRRIEGDSLGVLIRSALAEQRREALSLGSLIEVVLKLCDAVAYAHANGVIHRDIKPDNVMIGAFGEVMLVDWGAADPASRSTNEPAPIVGTLTYMAPEQLHGAPPSPSADIFALGATLFHSLLLRAPVRATTRELLLSRKLRGELDPPTSEELQRVPRPLLGIALKAMSANPHDRYPTVAAFAQALRDFSIGRNAWAAPLVVETFRDDSYLERWVSTQTDDFVREGERLVSQCQAGALLIYRQRLAAGLAVEFDGEILEGCRPGDISVLWTDEDLLDGGPHMPTRGTTWTLQIGAFANLLAGIYRNFEQCVAGRSFSITAGRKYRVRAEIAEHKLRLLLDGELVAEHEDLFPLSSGYLALYAYYPGKAFGNVNLYERGFPERVSPTAIGDAFFACKEFQQAARQYLRVEQVLPYTALAEEARYKRGVALVSEGDTARAEEVWSGLRDAVWRARATLHLVDADFTAGRHEHVVAELERLLAMFSTLRAAIIGRWIDYVMRLCASDVFALEPYVQLRERVFPDHSESAAAAASAEVARGNYRDVVERFPEQHVQFVEACNLLGDFELVASRYTDAPWLVSMALLRLNRAQDSRVTPALRGLQLLLQGDLAGALLHGSVEAQLLTGNYERALEDPYLYWENRAAALRGLDRDQEAADMGDARALAELDVGEEALARGHRLQERLYLLHHLAFRALFAGDENTYRRFREQALTLPFGALWSDVWIHRFFLMPLVDEWAGDRGAVERSLRQCLQKPGAYPYDNLPYLARLVLGEISEAEFRAQPCQLYITGRLCFGAALRAEFVGDRELSSRCYARYLSLPLLERGTDSTRGDPLTLRWAEFRLKSERGSAR
jgi:hypothetical protein